MSKEAIQRIRKQAEQGEIEELYLDNLKIEKITEDLKIEIEKLDDLMSMSLNDCHLVSLTNFPHCKNLIRLELMNNKFPARELSHISGLASLQSLSLGSNTIDRYEDLEPLKKFKDLVQLDLSDSPLAEKSDYRLKVFQFFPQLQILDNCDIEGNEYQYSTSNDNEGVDEDEDEGSENEDDNEEDSGDWDDDHSEEESDEDDEDEEDNPAKRVKK
jgi:Leucine-rich repeat (LRR) protein